MKKPWNWFSFRIGFFLGGALVFLIVGLSMTLSSQVKREQLEAEINNIPTLNESMENN